MGVGTLVVFIAMILVAAIAAGVVISTVTSLQSKAMITGAETITEVSNKLNFIQITGVNGSLGSIQNLSLLAKLAAGSNPISLEDALVSVVLDDSVYRLQYNSSVNLSMTGNQSQFYAVTYEVNGPDHLDGFIAPGDIARFHMYPPRNIGPDDEVEVSFVPKSGQTSRASFFAPDTISTTTVVLFP